MCGHTARYLEELGVLKPFPRSHAGNENTDSAFLFRTVKYGSGYPRKPFASIESKPIRESTHLSAATANFFIRALFGSMSIYTDYAYQTVDISYHEII